MSESHEHGRFAKGNKCGKGNPLNRRAQMLRAQCLRYMTPQKLWDVVDKLYEMAMEGDVLAARELLDRTLGKAHQPIKLDVDAKISGQASITHRIVKDDALESAYRNIQSAGRAALADGN